MAAVFCLHCRAAQGLAVADQLIKILGPVWDLVDHPGLEYLVEFLQVGLIEQLEKGGIRRPALEGHAQGLVQSLSMTPDDGLQVA